MPEDTTTVNPYFNRSAIRTPHDFIGRRAELREIGELLTQQQPIALYGERRAGKSSILNAISFFRERFRLPPDLRFVYVNCLYAEKSPERRFLRHLFGQIAGQLEEEPLPPERESLWSAIEQAQRNRCRLVVLMDEFDVLMQNAMIERALFSFLRAASQDITFVIASREGVVDWFLDSRDETGSPFWNIFKQVHVGPFPHEEAIQLIVEPASRCGAPFAADEVEWIHARGGHLPLFLQIAASNAFTRRHDRDSWDAAFRAEADQHFEYMLDFLPEKELAALLAVNRGEAVDERTQQNLLRKGILLREQGEVRVFSSALRDKLTARSQRADVAGPTAVLNKLFG